MIKKAMIKLATLRLAINYVLRTRMKKQGYIKQAAQTNYLGYTNYSDFKDFNNSNNSFKYNDSINLPQGNSLVYREEQLSHKPLPTKPDPLPNNHVNLNAIRNVTNLLQTKTPFWKPDGNVYLKDTNVNYHTANGNLVLQTKPFSSTADGESTVLHEFTHDYTPSLEVHNPYNLSTPTGSKFIKYDWRSPSTTIGTFSMEEPTTSVDWGYNLYPQLNKLYNYEQGKLQEAPVLHWSYKPKETVKGNENLQQAPLLTNWNDNSQPWDLSKAIQQLHSPEYQQPLDYSTPFNGRNPIDEASTAGLSYLDNIQKTPYLYFAPQPTPFGFTHKATPEEFISYTIPSIYNSKTNNTRELGYPSNLRPIEGQKKLLDNIVDYTNPNITGYKQSDLVRKFQIPTAYDFAWNFRNNPENVKAYRRELTALEEKYGSKANIPRTELQELDSKYRPYFKGEEALPDWANKMVVERPASPEIASNQVALYFFNTPTEQLNAVLKETYPDMTDEEIAVIKTKHARLHGLNDIDKEYYTYIAQPNWLLNHARRGLNIVNNKLTYTAPFEAENQRNNPETSEKWYKLYRDVINRGKQYTQNPYYINVMRKWETSPMGDGMTGLNTPTLTIEQMQQMMQDFDEADKRFELENSQQFQGYGYPNA